MKTHQAARSVMRLVLVLAVALLLLACPAPTIDGSSPTAVKVSLEEIERELSSYDRARLEHAMKFIVARELGAALGGSYGSASTADVDRKVAQTLDGKTVEEVIAYVEALRVEGRSGKLAPSP